MRIAHFNILEGTHFGGAENMMFQMAVAQKRRGHYVETWTHDLTFFQKKAEEAGLVNLNLTKYRNIKQLPLFIFYLKKLMRERKIDVLHSHLFSSIIRSGPASMLGFPHVVTLHDSISLTKRRYAIPLLKTFAYTGTQFATVSDEIEDLLLESKFPFDNHRLILNGVDVHGIQNTPRDRSILHQYGVNDDDVVITIAAALRPVKRHDFLIECIKKVNTQFPFKVLIVGCGSEKESIKSLIDRAGLSDKVILTGFSAETIKILRASDIFTLTSESEGLPCALQEAMAAGLPSVVTDVGGISRIVTNNREGFIYPFSDIERLSLAYKRLIEDKLTREQMGQNALRTISKGFSLDQTLDRYDELYWKAIKS